MADNRDSLPSTFENRGILVAFRHRMLQNIRLRVPEREDFRLREVEAVIQNYAGTGNKHLLIMPWLHVPTLAQIGKRDKALYDAVCAYTPLTAMDPLVLRELTNEIDRHDDEQPVAQAQAKAEYEATKVDRFRTYLGFLAQLTREVGVAMGDPLLAQIDSAVLLNILQVKVGAADGIDGTALTARIFNYLSRHIGTGIADITRRMETMAGMVAPFGAMHVDKGGKQDGYLMRQFHRLRAFRDEVSVHERSTSEEVANSCLLIIFAARQYIDYIEARQKEIDEKFKRLDVLIRDFDESEAFIRRIRRSVAFALDGWGQLIDVWDQAWPNRADDSKKIEIDRAVFYILQYLPLMPVSAVENKNDSRRIWHRYQFVRAKPVPAMYSWFDERPDEELIKRIETARSKAEQEGRSFGGETSRTLKRR